jgi:hypothetical protein
MCVIVVSVTDGNRNQQLPNTILTSSASLTLLSTGGTRPPRERLNCWLSGKLEILLLSLSETSSGTSATLYNAPENIFNLLNMFSVHGSDLVRPDVICRHLRRRGTDPPPNRCNNYSGMNGHRDYNGSRCSLTSRRFQLMDRCERGL